MSPVSVEIIATTVSDLMDKGKIYNFQFIISNFSFTLIELLIVITILITFSGFSLAYYNQFTEEKKLETETERLVDVLELAKKKTSSGYIGNYTCSVFFGYRVAVSNSYYELRLCCSSDCNTNQLIKNYTLPSNLSVTSGTDNIQFNPLTTKINSPTNITITLKNTSLNKCRQITISPAGLIDSTPNSSPC